MCWYRQRSIPVVKPPVLNQWLFRFPEVNMPVENNFIILSLIILLANTTEAISGFGSTIISVTLGSNFYPINELLPVLVPLNVLLSFYIVFRYHDLIDYQVLFKKILPFMG